VAIRRLFAQYLRIEKTGIAGGSNGSTGTAQSQSAFMDFPIGLLARYDGAVELGRRRAATLSGSFAARASMRAIPGKVRSGFPR
jgi:hypothetical protein